MAVFPVEPGSAPPPPDPEVNLWGLMVQGFLRAGFLPATRSSVSKH